MNEAQIGIVAIGRNEGERLKACLQSLMSLNCPVVYVDSGSSDGSVQYASNFGAEVVELDMSMPFSAARARNAGAQRLLQLHPGLEHIQFLDGDCLLADDWLIKASSFLASHAEYAVVCGRRRERFPDASIYNRLIDMEWDTPVGDAKACGGDSLVRVCAFQEVAGFTPNIVAGEEPEFCVRLRACGWRIMRMDAEMTKHDAAMSRFSQWWKRAKRAGYAYACGSFLHGQPPEKHWIRETRSAVAWGLFIPMLILIVGVLTQGWGFLLFSLYAVQSARVSRYRMQSGDSSRDAWLYSLFCVLAKFPESLGVLRFWIERMTGKKAHLIEYKSTPTSAEVS